MSDNNCPLHQFNLPDEKCTCEIPESFKQGMEEVKAIMSKTPRTDASDLDSEPGDFQSLLKCSQQLEAELTAPQSEHDAMKAELEEAKAEVLKYQRSFAGHVYIENDKYVEILNAVDKPGLYVEVIEQLNALRTQLAAVTKERDDSRENFQRVQSKVDELVLGSLQNLAKLAAGIVDIEQERDQWKECAERLGPYAAHLFNCDERSMRGSCNCGYRQVLSELYALKG